MQLCIFICLFVNMLAPQQGMAAQVLAQEERRVRSACLLFPNQTELGAAATGDVDDAICHATIGPVTPAAWHFSCTVQFMMN